METETMGGRGTKSKTSSTAGTGAEPAARLDARVSNLGKLTGRQLETRLKSVFGLRAIAHAGPNMTGQKGATLTSKDKDVADKTASRARSMGLKASVDGSDVADTGNYHVILNF